MDKKLKTKEYIFDELGQYDFIDEEYYEKTIDKYTNLIGTFITKFSCLEHEINIAIADFFEDDIHSTGYLVIEKLNIYSKIELFYNIYMYLMQFSKNEKLTHK